MKLDLNSSNEVLLDEDFLFFKEKIFQLSGIYLTDKKKDLVRSRIKSHNFKNGIVSFSQFRKMLQSAPLNSPIVQTFINLLTTNKTDFFREEKHFEILSQAIIKKWTKDKKKSVKIWCCAASTGEEPYTIAMVLEKHLPANIEFKILATDIDTNVLRHAQNGVYDIKKLDEIPDEYQELAITKGTDRAQGWFRIKDKIHSRIIFKTHNLVEPTYPGDEVFDLIFCRNVLIYFSQETIKTLMGKFHKTLKNDGLLFIGHSESIQGTGNIFKTIEPAVFSKVLK